MYYYYYLLFGRFIIYNSITERITADLLLVNFHYRDGATGQVSLLMFSFQYAPCNLRESNYNYSRDVLRMNELLDWRSHFTPKLITDIHSCGERYSMRCEIFWKNAFRSNIRYEMTSLRFLMSSFSPCLSILFATSRWIRKNVNISPHVSLENCILQRRLSSLRLDTFSPRCFQSR